MKPDELKSFFTSIEPDESLKNKTRDRIERAPVTAVPAATAGDPLKPKKKNRHLGLKIFAAAAAVFLVAFVLLPGIRFDTDPAVHALVTFRSYDDAEAYIRDREKLSDALRSYAFGCGLSLVGCSSSPGGTDSSPDPGESEPSYSETNTQVDGVDESDLVKTDGEKIYSLPFSAYRIGRRVNVYDVNTGEVSYVYLDDDSTPDSLYLAGDRLVVLAAGRTEATDDAPARTTTQVYVFDLSGEDGKAVRLAKFEYPAALADSRRVDDSLYLAMTDSTVLYRDALLIPEVTVNGETTPVAADDIFGVPGPAHNNRLTYLAVIDIEAAVQTDLKAYYGTFDNLYMNGSAIYTSATVYSYKRGAYGYTRTGTAGTIVNRYAVTDTGTSYHSSAETDGTVLNQFSMDEYDGYFRLATSLSDGGARLTVYSVGDALTEAARVEGMGKEDNERIYSVRYNGAVCYLVTARETDPLYVIDLTDPTQPVVASELKIPDVSDYMHMYDDNTVIGIGRQDQFGSFYGMQVSLFDVSERASPQKIDQILYTDDSYSPITNDHKAFLYHTLDSGETVFGFPILSDKSGYVLLTTDGKALGEVGWLLAPDVAESNPFAYIPDNTLRRAVIIGDRLYAISDYGLVVADLFDTDGALSLTGTETVRFL